MKAQEEKKSIIYEKGNIKLINKREKLFRLIDLDKYKLVRNKVNSAIRSDKVSETKAKLLSFKESNKAFYGYVRSKQKGSSHAAQLRKKDTT